MQRAEDAGLLRVRRVLSVDQLGSNQFEFNGKQYINFSSNDYLGLSQSATLIEALIDGAKRYGTGSGASPLVTGYSNAHHQLEHVLCQATGHEAALLFCSGFSANNALMKTLFDKQELVVADKLIHASLIDGLRDSGVNLKRFAHNDLAAASEMICTYQPQAVITESVFSMDGDCAPLNALYHQCQQAQSWLIVDDAHGFAVLEALGSTQATKADATNCDLQVVTFGKALGCQGAAILGTQKVINFLVANARDYIYSTALSPANAYVAHQAVLWCQQSQYAEQLVDVIDYFKLCCQQKQLNLADSITPIQPLIIGELAELEQVANQLREKGLWVGAIRPPTVPKGSARLRITLSLHHSKAQIDHLVESLSQALSSH
ncbi:8-amino-7-oxononanoate synthase [Shewanella sp. Isolate11]|uniref:aminotransferase class I/II-fold pyridoxal phosphate-dependent enzyme n=1 Tax=Shewanella sp. Isolate11 TaxID=2908530 RepID=UPI001EFEA821|nr:8-amino-7-oxononanoate synthase [Shewanella sp. Isolate11]MCG9696424.1 8-amino-7-oxononanoate synthase [Shewanella sp. Isolate11]